MDCLISSTLDSNVINTTLRAKVVEVVSCVVFDQSQYKLHILSLIIICGPHTKHIMWYIYILI